MNFCIYSGTFNPIHNAHLKVACGVLQQTNSDKIIFIPSFLPPHKQNTTLSAQHRLNMLKIALEDCEKFEVSDIEIKLKGKSYSFNTVSELKKIYKINERINFVIGTDAFEKLDSWYRAQEFADLVNFVLVPRSNEFDPQKSRDKIKLDNVVYQSLDVPFCDISSTQIRHNRQKGISIKEFVPQKVEDYIIKNCLYL